MIDIQDKSQCCGCGACAQRCPNACITMQEDTNGFLYPVVDKDACVDCHLCEQVCPVLNRGERQETLACYAAIHPDEAIRHKSSSGGVFTVLAERVIAGGGVVFGARFNEKWEVVHGFSETIEGLAAFRSSKYVQSAIGESYVQAERFLKQGREVLFTGTPCQIAGLKRFLRQDYPHLLAVEVACHGVPSPGVWRQYLRGRHDVAEVNFRDKSTGWRDYSVVIGKQKKRHDDDVYMACYLTNHIIRESCFDCPAKQGKSGADILIADLWGMNSIPDLKNDNKGTSAVLVYSSRGLEFVQQCGINVTDVDVDVVIRNNPSIRENAARPSDYDEFWKKYHKSPRWTLKRYGGLSFSKCVLRLKKWIRRAFR